jgi:hypothetical protein
MTMERISVNVGNQPYRRPAMTAAGLLANSQLE